MNSYKHPIIASRELHYALVGDSSTRRMTVWIRMPYVLTDEPVGFSFDPGVAGCDIGFDGLDEKGDTVYGADTLQALVLAVPAMNNYLMRLRKKYNFYFPHGEPYFEE